MFGGFFSSFFLSFCRLVLVLFSFCFIWLPFFFPTQRKIVIRLHGDGCGKQNWKCEESTEWGVCVCVIGDGSVRASNENNIFRSQHCVEWHTHTHTYYIAIGECIASIIQPMGVIFPHCVWWDSISLSCAISRCFHATTDWMTTMTMTVYVAISSPNVTNNRNDRHLNI